jgi:hypothetical protein
MQTISVNYTLKWQCKFDNKYQWSECGKLFNANTGRLKKKVYGIRKMSNMWKRKFN